MFFLGIIRMAVGSPTCIQVTGYAATFSNQAHRFFLGIIRMAVGSPDPNTFSDGVSRSFFETSRRWDSIGKFCRPQYYYCCKNTVLKNRILWRNITAHVKKTVR